MYNIWTDMHTVSIV